MFAKLKELTEIVKLEPVEVEIWILNRSWRENQENSSKVQPTQGLTGTCSLAWENKKYTSLNSISSNNPCKMKAAFAPKVKEFSMFSAFNLFLDLY